MAGPGAAGYVARLREGRYSPRGARPPGRAARRALRRELTAAGGPLARLRGFRAAAAARAGRLRRLLRWPPRTLAMNPNPASRSNFLSGLLGGLVVLILGAVLIATDVIDTGDTTREVVSGTGITQPANDDASDDNGRSVSDIYKDEGRGVVFIQARRASAPASSPRSACPRTRGHGHRLGLRGRQGRHDHHQRPRRGGRGRGPGPLRRGQRRVRGRRGGGPRPVERPRRAEGRSRRTRSSFRSRSATRRRSTSATRRSRSATRSASRARSPPASSRRSSARSRRPTASRSAT